MKTSKSSFRSHIQKYAHTCAHVYTNTCTHVSLYTHIRAYMHHCIHIYLHTSIIVYTHTCIIVYMYTCTVVYMHTCIKVKESQTQEGLSRDIVWLDSVARQVFYGVASWKLQLKAASWYTLAAS